MLALETTRFALLVDVASFEHFCRSLTPYSGGSILLNADAAAGEGRGPRPSVLKPARPWPAAASATPMPPLAPAAVPIRF